MFDSFPPEDAGLNAAAIFLAAGGWLGLLLIVLLAFPDVGARWFFFVLWLMAITGSAVPFIRYLNKRFASQPPASAVLLREAVLVGLFGATCAWLQINRALSPALAVLVAAGLMGIELLLRWREAAQRKAE